MTLNGCLTTKVYCRPDCPPGRRTMPKNRVHFASEAEAVERGFRACKVCRPNDPADGKAWRPRRVRRRE